MGTCTPPPLEGARYCSSPQAKNNVQGTWLSEYKFTLEFYA